jgi:hypothetical protein
VALHEGVSEEGHADRRHLVRIRRVGLGLGLGIGLRLGLAQRQAKWVHADRRHLPPYASEGYGRMRHANAR